MRTQDAKNIHINDYLERIGAKFSRQQNGTHGLEYVYHTPNRQDLKPSLCVNLERNIWSDVPAGEGGRLIELVCYIHRFQKNDVSSALKMLDQLFPEYRGSGHTSAYSRSPNHSISSILAHSNNHNSAEMGATSLKEEEKPKLSIKKIQKIYRYPLKNYLADRRIPLALAEKYLEEIEYCDPKGRTFYTLGFKAGDTYAHRNKLFKGFLGKGADITIFDKKTPEILVFEGFFDFLSYLAIEKRSQPPLTTIVMNSTSFISRVRKFIAERPFLTRVYTYLDNDEAGQRSFMSLKKEFPSVEISDRSATYAPFDDLNEWLIHH